MQISPQHINFVLIQVILILTLVFCEPCCKIIVIIIIIIIIIIITRKTATLPGPKRLATPRHKTAAVEDGQPKPQSHTFLFHVDLQ